MNSLGNLKKILNKPAQEKFITSPIIFIHYGNTPYLEYTLRLARYHNPNKRVILLGDESNAWLKKIDIEHYLFADFARSTEVDKFNQVYKFIAGEKKRKPEWTKFVFLRWFYIYNFIREYGIKQFWTFDSDTLILADLSTWEGVFIKFDCTTQCRGSCLNGFVASQEVVKKYVEKINELFERVDYLNEQKEEMKRDPNWAFTEMRAFDTYKKEERLNVCLSMW